MTDDPLEQLLDVALYAPLGLALAARERLPEFAERGRREIEARVPAARFVGQVVLDEGTKEFKKRLDDLPRRLKEVLTGLGVLGACSFVDDEPSEPGASREPGSSPEPGFSPEPDDDSDPTASPIPVVPVGDPEAEAETASLPIPGYDTLSASQVVQRLPGLSEAELEAISSYETARRARKIVLLKVAQLRAAS